MAALADSSKRWHIVLRCTICGPLGLLFFAAIDTYLRSLKVPLTSIAIRYPHDTIRIITMRIAIQNSSYDTYRDTELTLRYVSRYRTHVTIRIAIQRSHYDTYRDTALELRYVSRYRAHFTIRIAIQNSRYVYME